MESAVIQKNSDYFLISIVMLFLLGIDFILYVTGNPYWSCFVSAVFVLFTSEHVFNFIKSSNISVTKNVNGTIFHRLFSLLIPMTIVFITWLVAL